MQPFHPSLDLIRQAFGSRVLDCTSVLIKQTFAWHVVYRVTLELQGHPARRTVIVKANDPAGPRSALELEREPRFYQTLHPILPVPKPAVHFIGTDAASGWYVIVMQDLEPTHFIPRHPHAWTLFEMDRVLQAYARLHTAALPGIDTYPWLAPRHESQLDFDRIPDHVEAVQRAGLWGTVPKLDRLIACAREGCGRYASEKTSLLHGDTTPTNAPIPKDPGAGPATLIDWQDAGVGMPEMDLAYIDLQPFESGRALPRPDLLALYWRHRAPLGTPPAPAERAARQFHADLVMALWLTRPAGRVAGQPYPQGSYQHDHWQSAFGILYNRLLQLGDQV